MSREISAFLSHFLVRPPLGAVQRLFGSHQGAVRCLRGFAARDCVHFLGDRHDFGASHRSRAPQYQMFSIGRMSVKFVNKDTIALSGATESFMVLVRDSMLAVALLAVTFWHNWQLMLMTVFLVAASPFVLCSISLRRRLIVKASQDNVGAMHSRVEESYGAQKLVQAACSCDSDGRHFAPVKAALARLARGKTTVTTIADTDWIVVLDNGVVHEQVTQAELLVRPSGLFHQLYKLQTAGRTHP